jgi:hypothetical protein
VIEIQRYGCLSCAYTLHAPTGLYLSCPACAARTRDEVPMEPVAKFGPVPGTTSLDPEDRLSVNVQTRVSESVAARIDAVRGEASRSEWLRDRLSDWLATS